MNVLFTLLGILVLLFLGHLFLVMPRSRRESAEKFMRIPYAHRGLHSDKIPENSLAAFRAAVEQGFGIELDVQLSADGEVMVFHDESLLRMTGCDASLYAQTREQLGTLRLGESEERIPTLSEVLSLVDGRVPLLIEVKPHHALTELCEKTAALLDGYGGAYMMESFHPMAVNWFRKHRPAVVRGQLSSHLFVRGDRTVSMFLVQNLLLNFLSRPDFIAYCYRDRHRYSFALCRRVFRPFTVAWTVREKEALAKCRGFDAVIFEHVEKEALQEAGRLPDTCEGEKNA